MFTLYPRQTIYVPFTYKESAIPPPIFIITRGLSTPSWSPITAYLPVMAELRQSGGSRSDIYSVRANILRGRTR